MCVDKDVVGMCRVVILAIVIKCSTSDIYSSSIGSRWCRCIGSHSKIF